MSDRPPPPARPPREELAELAREVRGALEMQEILLTGGRGTLEVKAAPPAAKPAPQSGPAAPGTRAVPRPAARQAPPPAPAPPSQPRVAPAARVQAAPPAAPPPTASPRAKPAADQTGPIYGAVPPPEQEGLFVEPAAQVQHPWQRDPSEFASFGELHDAFLECRRCQLCETRTHMVFGSGNPKAKLMFIGEAPGRDEDLQGEAFVGRAGQLLTKILAAIDFTRDDVYIANILKCRPPGNRDPEPTEIACCQPILNRQIQIMQPVILCTLGAFAARTLLGVRHGISRLRGQIHYYRGTIPLIPTFHPAALLRNPNWKRPTWEDVQMLRREYDRLVAEAETRTPQGSPP